eukprot:2716302-Amphidinium_carterae.1
MVEVQQKSHLDLQSAQHVKNDSKSTLAVAIGAAIATNIRCVSLVPVASRVLRPIHGRNFKLGKQPQKKPLSVPLRLQQIPTEPILFPTASV